MSEKCTKAALWPSDALQDAPEGKGEGGCTWASGTRVPGHVLIVRVHQLGDVGKQHDVAVDEEHARNAVALHEQLHHKELHVPPSRVQRSLRSHKGRESDKGAECG